MSKSILDKKREIDENGKEIKRVLSIIGDVTIYSPTLEQEKILMNFIEKHIDEKTKKVEITGVEVFRILYKELTDLKDIDKVTDDELENIINRPNEELEEINEILNDEIFKISKKILNVQKQMVQTINTLISGENLKSSVETINKNIISKKDKVI
ncbi:hypothetical protein [Clostridium tyrobutyricum]|uniref:hypothetical protein n=1 Tax=Clostridium tyrobutyricum TaxID=1519 RepID=UPI002B1FEDFF|nr:hypothetical protein [Clostridium tyrobutyricum]MEA5008762.1 hypothetical protein [Clostridium tyrobutyricum]